MGLTHYFTGKPCVHGHTDKRYTVSGACATCLNLANSSTRQAMGAAPRVPAPEPLDPAAVQDWNAKAIAIKYRLRDKHVAQFAELVMWLCVARWPTLPPETFRQMPRGVDRVSGTCLYAFRVHAEDDALLLAETNKLLREGAAVQMPDWSALNRQLDAVDPTPWPEGDPK